MAASRHRTSLRRWETDWSSQTGACQAGLLHGSNEDMPAFRWWEKERGAAIVTNHPRDAEELERRRSDGRGLLHADGASRANILSGDAAALDADDEHRAAPPPADRPRLRGLFRPPLRRLQDDRPRPRRRDPGAPRRAGPGPRRRQAEDQAQPLLCPDPRLGDGRPARPAGRRRGRRHPRRPADDLHDLPRLRRGRPPLRDRAPRRLAVLRDLDRQIARIARACADAPRPYRLVVLSDHGQSQGETFRDRYGETLEQVVRSACGARSVARRRKRRRRRRWPSSTPA